jgi:hypothetical protein
MASVVSVEFTKDNATKCLCGGCPVQKDSVCVAQKQAALGAAMEGETDGMPSAADLPRLYCATGVATCGDLDFAETCQCMHCPVYRENGLDQWKYCERGAAMSIG